MAKRTVIHLSLHCQADSKLRKLRYLKLSPIAVQHLKCRRLLRRNLALLYILIPLSKLNGDRGQHVNGVSEEMIRIHYYVYSDES